MRLVVPAETRPGEARVGLVPDSVPKLVAAGLEVVVESGAGAASRYADAAYEAVGAVWDGLIRHVWIGEPLTQPPVAAPD